LPDYLFFHISLWVNNVEQIGKGESDVGMTSSDVNSSGGVTILTIPAGHWISLRIKNTANNNDPTFTSGNFFIKRL